METEQLVSERGWDYRIAKSVSYAFSPPLIITIGILLAAAAIGTVRGWYWAIFYGLMVVILPTIYIVWKVRRGEITDFHIRVREQRIKPLTISMLLGIFSWIVMYVFAAPDVLLILGGAGLLQLIFMVLVTLKWKMSGHSTTISAWAVFLIWLFGMSYWPILITIPLVAWARVRLNRHEILQTIVGSAVGVVFMVAAFYLVSRFTTGISL